MTVENFVRIIRTVFKIVLRSACFEYGCYLASPRSRDRGPTDPSGQFLGIPPLTQPYDFDAIAHIGQKAQKQLQFKRFTEKKCANYR